MSWGDMVFINLDNIALQSTICTESHTTFGKMHTVAEQSVPCCAQSPSLGCWTAKAVPMQVIDFEPEEPVQRGDRQHQSSRRKRITRVLLLVLQVVNSELATQSHSSETKSQAVAFVARHCRMMQRVLREAAIGSLNGWQPGEQEAELAALVLSLVTQLPFGQLSQQPGAPAGDRMLQCNPRHAMLLHTDRHRNACHAIQHCRLGIQHAKS